MRWEVRRMYREYRSPLPKAECDARLAARSDLTVSWRGPHRPLHSRRLGPHRYAVLSGSTILPTAEDFNRSDYLRAVVELAPAADDTLVRVRTGLQTYIVVVYLGLMAVTAACMVLRIGFSDAKLVDQIGRDFLSLFPVFALMFVFWDPFQLWLASRRESPLATSVARVLEAEPIHI